MSGFLINLALVLLVVALTPLAFHLGWKLGEWMDQQGWLP